MINPVSWTWSKVWNSQIAQRIRGVQQQFERRDPDPGQTTLLGTPGTPSPRIPEESRLFSQRYDRR
ncbi:MAG TPA: hypothetical protein VFQ92_20095, partial [Blastocatellia bacterium]|nr:hypothetical protein [Blastocatellia bacterium]